MLECQLFLLTPWSAGYLRAELDNGKGAGSCLRNNGVLATVVGLKQEPLSEDGSGLDADSLCLAKLLEWGPDRAWEARDGTHVSGDRRKTGAPAGSQWGRGNERLANVRFSSEIICARLRASSGLPCASARPSHEDNRLPSNPQPTLLALIPTTAIMSIAQRYPAHGKYAPPLSPVTPSTRRHDTRHRSMRTLSLTITRETPSTFDFSLPAPLATPPASPPRASGTRKVELPLSLPYVPFPPVDRAGVESLDPELRGVPVEYVAHKLRGIGPELMGALPYVTPPQTAYPASNMPAWVDVRVSSRLPSLESLPSHVLCVVNPQSKQPGQLLPVHALIYAAQCSNFPRLSRAAPHVDAQSKCARLAVVPLYVPSPATFSILNSYLYTKRPERLLSTLAPLSSGALASIPIGEQGPTNTVAALGRAMSDAFPPAKLVEHAAVVHGLWGNVMTLGVDDEVLWWALETAWEIITTAIAIASGQQI
ncbi:Clp1-like protein [Ceratobasidium theobromae]|uniref:Clp1-like protein n=1 Tax=Ceratobasidium theobromae TaxID=1582974 RepID=A0A5N5QU50_9AGAM|nr:Clp1-like protein [Ceratobasidium theobromae]